MGTSFVGLTVQIADPDGDLYDATVLRIEGDHYIADLNGHEIKVYAEDVERAMYQREQLLGFRLAVVLVVFGAATAGLMLAVALA